MLWVIVVFWIVSGFIAGWYIEQLDHWLDIWPQSRVSSAICGAIVAPFVVRLAFSAKNRNKFRRVRLQRRAARVEAVERAERQIEADYQETLRLIEWQPRELTPIEQLDEELNT